MMKMKALGLSFATVASFGLLVNLPVQAATDPLAGNSVGEFEVAKGTLTLDNVPTFAFEGTDVKTLVTQGADLAYTNDTIKNGTTTGTSLKVSDYRGSDQPVWNLNAKMSDFTNKTTTITGTLTYATDGSATGTKLALPKTTGVSTGTYDADLTWTLSSTASDTASD